jgi:hypothetical protein
MQLYQKIINQTEMLRLGKSFGILLVLLIVLLPATTGCAASKKYTPVDKRKESLCDLTHLGKNKYYYSGYYKRKLHKAEYKIKHR